MQSKLFPMAVMAALAMFASIATAQVTQVTGKVTLKQADGTVRLVQGALIDIYRTDVPQRFQASTDETGVYTHSGIPFIGTYTMVVSAIGAQSQYRADIRLMRNHVHNFELVPGNGSRLTLEQIREGAARQTATGEAGNVSDDLDRKKKEIDETNKNITSENEIVSRTFNAGNEALKAGQLDEAINQYREGLAARPDEPALLTNLSEALRLRGVKRFNASTGMKDPAAKGAGMDEAKKDWSDAAQASRKALELASRPSSDPPQQQIYTQTKLAATATYAAAMRFVATRVDQTQAAAAWNAYEAYIRIEVDPARKVRLRSEALQMLFEAGSLELCISQARKVVAAEPDDLTANRVLGLALFATGETENFQEAADRLQRYVDVAPDSDLYKAGVRESLEYLKNAGGITPRKKSRP